MNSLDTNILVYATDETDVAKHLAARKLLDRAVTGGWPIAAQVYGEYFSLVTRRRLTTLTEARDVIEAWSESMRPLPSTVTAHAAALSLAADKQMQYRDALIIATCAERGVKQLDTENVPGSAKPLGVRCTSPW